MPADIPKTDIPKRMSIMMRIPTGMTKMTGMMILTGLMKMIAGVPVMNTNMMRNVIATEGKRRRISRTGIMRTGRRKPEKAN